MLKCVRLFSEEGVTEKTGNAEQPSCSSWQSDAKELSSDEYDWGIVIAKTLKFFLATSVLRIPTQFKQEICETVLGVLPTPYSWR